MVTRTLSSLPWPPADPDQELAASRFGQYGKVMVGAPPGSGKTFACVYLALYAHRVGWTSDSRRTLLLTFSRNARVQIEQEVDRFRTQGWMSAAEAKTIEISNYHSFYFTIISRRAGLWGCRIPLYPATTAEGRERIRRAVKKAGLKGNDFVKAARTAEEAPSLFLLDQEDSLSPQVKAFLVQEAERGLLLRRPHYDDFAPLLLDLLRVSPPLLEWLRVTYPVVILDEYQDTDDIQWEILRRWNPGRLAIFFDRFQMIYGWRGASQDRPDQAVVTFQIPPQAVVEFSHIHRVGAQRELGDFVCQLRKDNLAGNAVTPSSGRPWLNLLAVRSPAADTNMPIEMRCCNAIRWRSGIDVQKSTAIITRFNHLARFLRRELSHRPRKQHGPFFRCSWIGGTDSPDEAMRNKIDALRNARTRADVGRWLGELLDELMVKPFQVGGRSVLFGTELAKPTASILDGRRAKLKVIRENLTPWWDELAIGNYPVFRRALEFVLAVAHLLAEREAFIDPECAFYIRQLIKATKAAPSGETWAAFCDRLENSVLAGSHFKHTVKPGLYILTAHQSKGREFDHVILPWIAGSGEPIGWQARACYNDEEERRLLYVAVTRARSLVTILYPEEDPAQVLFDWKLLYRQSG